MRAKDFLKNRKKVMFYYDEVDKIVNDLYDIRLDREATELYYEQILWPEVRFSNWQEEHEEWLNTCSEHGFGLEEPEYVKNKWEINIDDAFGIREQLLEVVKDDKSFGYIAYLLSKEDGKKPNQQEIEEAIYEEQKNEEITKEMKTGLENSESVRSKYRIAKDKKTDFIKIISSMYDCRLFETQDGKFASNKQDLFNILGVFFNEDFKQYSTLLSNARYTENFLEIFDKLKERAKKYSEKEDNRKK